LITRRIAIFLIFVILFTASRVPSASAAPYDSYNYSYWGESVPSPAAYLPSRVIDGNRLGVGTFREPEDLFVAEDGQVYILDSGNNRIVQLNGQWEAERVISSFLNGSEQDTFNKPQGIYVTKEGNIYVADTENQRIVELNADGTLARIIGAPESDVFREQFRFFPRKIALDKAGRIYAAGRGVFEGIIEFDSDGVFSRFTGTNRVRVNPIDYLWKRIATDAQRDRMVRFIPVEFNNLDIDEEGFIYTTTAELNNAQPVQRLNPKGTDVLRRNGYFPQVGDVEVAPTGRMSGPSVFIDVNVNGYGMYSVLDSKRSRVFTYNEDGDLLYTFGQPGNQAGTFRLPVAVDNVGDMMLVLDKGANAVTVFEPTLFGANVNAAVRHYFDGNEDASAEAWAEVLRLNANYEIAYIGIGKALYRQGRNAEAMEYFLHGNEREYYSKAFTKYRKELLREHFGLVMTGIVLLIAALFSLPALIRSFRRRREANVGRAL